jgi:hypothetical protein
MNFHLFAKILYLPKCPGRLHNAQNKIKHIGGLWGLIRGNEDDSVISSFPQK